MINCRVSWCWVETPKRRQPSKWLLVNLIGRTEVMLRLQTSPILNIGSSWHKTVPSSLEMKMGFLVWAKKLMIIRYSPLNGAYMVSTYTNHPSGWLESKIISNSPVRAPNKLEGKLFQLFLNPSSTSSLIKTMLGSSMFSLVKSWLKSVASSALFDRHSTLILFSSRWSLMTLTRNFTFLNWIGIGLKF